MAPLGAMAAGWDDRPSTEFHSPFVREFNGAASGEGFVPLTPADLMATARQETGLEDFGSDDFLEPMDILLNAAEADAALNPFGRLVLRSRTLNSLKNRLWAQYCFNAHPQIRKRPLSPPIVIVGPHRSGTTRLHSLMAEDARLRHLTTWEGLNPAPRPEFADGGRELRRDEVVQSMSARGDIYPGAFLAHPMHADWPEEEMLLMNHAFAGFSPLGLYRVPAYVDWFMRADKLAAYRELADWMRLLEWGAGEPAGRPWILKNPQHMLNLDSLLRVFPDARLVFLHRDPRKTVGSVMSLMWTYAVQHTDEPCRAWIRDTWLAFCEQSARRCIESRKTIPTAQQIDVAYADVSRDWRSAIRRVQAFCGLSSDEQAENAMAAWIDRGRLEGRHGGHRYCLEDFGCDAATVDGILGFYRDRYAVEREEPATG